MPDYAAPLDDIRFFLHDLLDLEALAALPGCEEMTPDVVDAILAEAGRFGEEVLAPLNRVGDQEGCVLENGVVRTPTGFKGAFRGFADGGWASMNGDAEYGGMGLPSVVVTAVNEIMTAANMAFSLCPLLGQAAVELLEMHGTKDQKKTYLPNLLSGEWCATMNLTEPQAGSDLGRVRTRATPENGHYRITGQKIFITYGEHDLSENIVHLVLARTPDAPAGTRGISLFIVPKFLINGDGGLGGRNDLRCVSLEHKMGLHASPTAVMSYGDDGGAVGYLVGEENRGLEYMFTMMNNARIGVGTEGVAIAELAAQYASTYAHERIQGRAADGGSDAPVAIIDHPDVRRMLLSMRAQTDACRALLLYTAHQLDLAMRHPDETVRAGHQSRVDLLTPVVKAWSTDVGVEVANIGIQVHGGVGYIEETGAAQLVRDGRIMTIYEGTNGIQAIDLLSRKVMRDGGAALRGLISEIHAFREAAAGSGDDEARMLLRLGEACDILEGAADWAIAGFAEQPRTVTAGAVHFLRLVGIVSGGWLLARSGRVARQRLQDRAGDPVHLNRKLLSVRFFAENYLPEAALLSEKIIGGGETVAAAAAEYL